eukprot:1187624-Alexandrium_andersonii.AAC.1
MAPALGSPDVADGRPRAHRGGEHAGHAAAGGVAWRDGDARDAQRAADSDGAVTAQGALPGAVIWILAKRNT